MMKDSLWMIIVVVAVFLGFLIGYSVPPLVEVGMIGNQGGKAGVKTEVETEMQDYYRDLHKEE